MGAWREGCVHYTIFSTSIYFEIFFNKKLLEKNLKEKEKLQFYRNV